MDFVCVCVIMEDESITESTRSQTFKVKRFNDTQIDDVSSNKMS